MLFLHGLLKGFGSVHVSLYKNVLKILNMDFWLHISSIQKLKSLVLLIKYHWLSNIHEYINSISDWSYQSYIQHSSE